MGRSAKKARLQLTFKDKVTVVFSAAILVIAILFAIYLSLQQEARLIRPH
jgi:hypothetical protein